MSERTSFSYDPARQGYDTNSWRTISGAPSIGAGGRLLIDSGGDSGAVIHYADFLKGDISFSVNVPDVPGANDGRFFGLSDASGLSYIRFQIGEILTCATSNGVTTTQSSSIEWNSSWTSANIEFRIIWEAGGAKFMINGTEVYEISDGSVPYGPLSLYLSDSSASAMTIGVISVRGTQSFVMNPKTSDTTSFSGLILAAQAVTITESVTMKIPTLMLPFVSGGLFESVTVSENLQFRRSLPLTFESVTITESITLVRI